MIAWLIITLESTPLRQWFIYGTRTIVVALTLAITGGNLREIWRIRRFRLHRARFYAIRVWGCSAGLLLIFLLVECIVVDTLGVLTLLVLSDVTLY